MHATPPEKTFWGWKALILAFILSILFLGIFYLAMENEPDYMPSQQQKLHQQHAEANAKASSSEQAAEPHATHGSAEAHGMSQEEHANMDSHTQGGHGH